MLWFERLIGGWWFVRCLDRRVGDLVGLRAERGAVIVVLVVVAE